MRFGLVVLFGMTSFLGAALLFSVQPMIGKMVLPVFGGTPAVWNTCLVYFQVMLLGGYLFAHALHRVSGATGSKVRGAYLPVFAVMLLAGYLLQPVTVGSIAGWTFFRRSPAVDLLLILTVSATLPLLLVSATAPLLQGWFSSLTPHPRANDPYFLYAASNAGSLLALLAYPIVIEPALGLREQSRVWRSGFLLLGVLAVICGATAFKLSRFAAIGNGGDRSTEQKVSVLPAVVVQWIVLVFIPSSWLMGVTTYLTTDLAAIPLLWVIPLAIYLVSFILAFARSGARAVRIVGGFLPYLVALLALVMSAGFPHLIWIPLHLAAFFAGSVACHGALARARPAAELASVFYVAIAAGGLLGGIFTALVAPVVFNRVVEYPLAVILGSMAAGLSDVGLPRLAFRAWLRELLLPAAVLLLTAVLATNQSGLAESFIGVLGVMIASGLGLLATVTARQRPLRFALCVAAVLAGSGLSSGKSGRLIHAERSFFGVVRVTHDPEQNVRRLFHGTTLHGQQSLDPALAHEPSTYFTRSGPIGEVFKLLGPSLKQPGSRVAILGLGAGTLATYAQPEERWTFYEIDPVIARIARDPRYFTYLRDCRALAVEIVLGDARLRLREAPDHAFGLIVLDAFSSDSLPVHLLSAEAIALYRSKLAAGGVLAFNLSNRYLDLDPVLGRQAASAGLACRIAYDLAVSPEEQRSIWGVMAENEDDLRGMEHDSRWQLPHLRGDSAVWTDDFSDLASYIRWWPPQRIAKKGTNRPGS